MATSKVDVWDLVNTVAPHTRRVLLYGPPGTGKSYLARTAGVEDPNKVYPVPVHSDLAAVELRGHFVHAGDAEGFRWADGPATTAWRNGGRLVLDEVDRASDDALSFLLGVLDDHETAKLVLSTTGETITPHENFTVWATMNGEPEDLPDALADRFPVTVNVTTPNPAAVATLPTDLRRMATALAAHPESDRRIGLRSFLEFARLRKVIEPKVAAQLVFAHRADEVMDSLSMATATEKK